MRHDREEQGAAGRWAPNWPSEREVNGHTRHRLKQYLFGGPDDLDARSARLAELMEELEQLRAKLAAVEEGRDEDTAEPLPAPAPPVAPEVEPAPTPQEPAPPERHLLFVPASDGYTLADRDGPPPDAGTQVELAGETVFLVSKL